MMRIAIVAPGGVGGYFGGLLARAGEEVVALARGSHLAAIQKTGLRIEGHRGDFTVRMQASEDAGELGVADIVIFAVKLFQLEAAARAAVTLFGPKTIGISLLNGIEGPALIAKELPDSTILAGCAYVSAVIIAPGHVRYTGDLSSIVLGAPVVGTWVSEKVGDFTQCCQRAGFDVKAADDVRSALWNKLIGLSTNSALTAASRLSCGLLYTDPEIVEVATALIAEASAVARAEGVQLPEGVESEWLARLKSFPPGLYASMYFDIAHGKPIEVEWLSGYIVRVGKRLGVPTPHHAALYAVLKPYRNGTPVLG